MARKSSIIKAYKRKWRRMPKKDRIFVIRFLGTAFLILVLVLALLGFLLFHLFHHIDFTHSSSGSGKDFSVVSSVQKSQDGDENIFDEEKTSSEENGTENDEKGSENEDAGETENEEDADESSADETPQEDLSSNADVQLLARLIYAETGSSSDRAQIAVASVVLNRVNSDIFPDTISEVIYQHGQYSPTWNGSINNTPDEQALRNASYVYQNGSQIPSNVLYQARYRQGSGVWAQIDGNFFCYK